MLTKSTNGTAKRASEETLMLRDLEPSEYPLWDALVDVSPQGTVFCRSWWLKAVGDVRVLGCFSGSELVAGIPLYFKRRFGVSVCTMPKLTRAWGVIMRPREGKPVVAASWETRVLRAFAVQLSRYKIFLQSFHPTLSNWLPFYWSGFQQTTRFTYVLDDLSDLNRVWNEMSSDARCKVRKAGRNGLSFVPCGTDEVYECECKSFLVQGKRPTHSETLLRKLYTAAKENNSGSCFAVVDGAGNTYSACFVVWDKNRAYDLAGGVDRELKCGASSLGKWETIRFVAQRSRAFDFAGSVIEGVERFNRGFGARQVPYNLVTKTPALVHSYLQMAGKL